MGRPLAEVLTKLFMRELHVQVPDAYPHPENSSEEHMRVHMMAMHQVVETLSLFNLEFSVDSEGMVEVSKVDRIGISPTDIGPPKLSYQQSRHMGYTGDSCGQCGSMQVVQNGTCNKCLTCGSTTGCS